MSVRCKNANSTENPPAFFGATKMSIMLHTDTISEISEIGCQVFD